VHIARHDLRSHYDLYVVQQHGVLCEVISGEDFFRVIRIKLNQLF